MIWLDIVLLAPLLWGAYSGFKKGLVAQILGLLSLSRTGRILGYR